MKWTACVLCLAIGIFVLCPTVFAGFHASDLLYLPVVAHLAGAEESLWRSDVFISNVDSTAIDVAMIFIPSGLVDNSSLFDNRDLWLGGRAEEGFGFVNESLADIQPNGTVVLRDLVGEYWMDDLLNFSGLGAVVVFAYEAGTLDNEDGRVFRNAVVYSRTYNETTIWVPDAENEGEFIEQEATYGQLVPAVPWYNLADASIIDDTKDLTMQVLPAGEATDIYRYNVGLLNASDPQTSITVAVEPFYGNGDAYTDDEGNALVLFVPIPPLGHVQYNQILSEQFGIAEATDVMLRVRFVSWTTTSPDPIKVFTSYGSVAEGRTNDATTILPSFVDPYDVECMWGPADGGEAAAKARHSGAGLRATPRRSLEIPSR